MSDVLNVRDKWLLTIIGSVPYVEGRTRLQKFGILSARGVLAGEDFFDDWQSYKYGLYSPELRDSLDRMKWRRYVRSFDVPPEQEGVAVTRYRVTDEGRSVLGDFAEKYSDKANAIKSMLLPLFPEPLDNVLALVHPECAKDGQIEAAVNLHRNPASNRTPVSGHVLGDLEYRERIARSIGLESVPCLDPGAFRRIRGLWSKRMDAGHVDSEELIREVRGCP